MKLGDKKTFQISVDEKRVQAFAALSGDYNPIHVDEKVAGQSEFQGRIAHGALLLAHASKMLGMDLPGPGCVILRQDIQFPKPLKYPEDVVFEGEITVFNEVRGDGKVQICARSPQGVHLIANVFFLLHGQQPPVIKEKIEQLPLATKKNENAKGKRLLITGGTGGVGQQIVEALGEEYECVVVTRKKMVSDRVHYANIDLEDESQLDRFLLENDPSLYFGIVHMSSSRPVERRVVGAVSELRKHIYHNIELPIRLAAWAEQSQSTVQRMILMGSTAGSKKLERSTPTYSLAKALVDPLAKLLSMDLGRKGITVNTVAPGFIPSGINAGVPARHQASLAGMSPTGRLTAPGDIVAVIRFLLSKEAAQINGSLLTVDGGGV